MDDYRHHYDYTPFQQVRHCRICGREYIAHSRRSKYCGSKECRDAVRDRKNRLRKLRRERMSALGIKTGMKGNK